MITFVATHAFAGDNLPPSNRIKINLGATPSKYVKDVDDSNSMQPGFDESGWQSVGVPQTPADDDTSINVQSDFGGDLQRDLPCDGHADPCAAGDQHAFETGVISERLGSLTSTGS